MCNTCMDLDLGFCDSVFVYLHPSPSLIIDAENDMAGDDELQREIDER